MSIAANYIDDSNSERGKLEATLASLGGAVAEQEAAAAVAGALAAPQLRQRKASCEL